MNFRGHEVEGSHHHQGVLPEELDKHRATNSISQTLDQRRYPSPRVSVYPSPVLHYPPPPLSCGSCHFHKPVCSTGWDILEDAASGVSEIDGSAVGSGRQSTATSDDEERDSDTGGSFSDLQETSCCATRVVGPEDGHTRRRVSDERVHMTHWDVRKHA